MQQFDIVQNLNAVTRHQYPLAVVLQHDRIHGLPTVVVAPLTRADEEGQLDRLHPVVPVDGTNYRVLIEELAAVQRRTLGRTIASAEAERYALVAALDQLFTGI